MPTFSYRAMDRAGKEIRGKIDASGEEIVVERLRTMGYFPTEVVRDKTSAGNIKLEELPGIRHALKLISRGKVKSKHLTPFTRQLATLIGAGLPLLRSLQILGEQVENNNLKEAILGMAEDIEGGATFSEALSKFPRVFDRLYINMVRAGEVSGALETVLDRLAIFAEKSAAVASKVKGALFYPVVVVLVACTVVGIILVFVVPNFVSIFKELGAELPGMTQFLLTCSNIVTQKYYYLIIGVIGIFMIYKFLRKYEWGRFATDTAFLKMPVFGKLIQKSGVARFARTFSTLLDTGVPILQALTIVKDTSGNEVISRAVWEVHNSIREGETISEPLKKFPIFPPLVVHMVSVGEETGAIDSMLLKVAEAYEREVDDMVDGLSKLIEPILIVFLGGIIGFIVIALYLPIFTVGNHIK